MFATSKIIWNCRRQQYRKGGCALQYSIYEILYTSSTFGSTMAYLEHKMMGCTDEIEFHLILYECFSSC